MDEEIELTTVDGQTVRVALSGAVAAVGLAVGRGRYLVSLDAEESVEVRRVRHDEAHDSGPPSLLPEAWRWVVSPNGPMGLDGPPNMVASALARFVDDEFGDDRDSAGSAHFNKGDFELEHKVYATAFWKLAAAAMLAATRYAEKLGGDASDCFDPDAKHSAWVGFGGLCECGSDEDGPHDTDCGAA